MIEIWMEEKLRELPGWMPTLYWPTETTKARAVLVSPDYRKQLGRGGETVDDALARAIAAVKLGQFD
jgi:hypothetical protein